MENMAKRVIEEAMETMVLLGVPVNKVRDIIAIQESSRFIFFLIFALFNLGPRGLPGFPGPQGLVGPVGKFFQSVWRVLMQFTFLRNVKKKKTNFLEEIAPLIYTKVSIDISREKRKNLYNSSKSCIFRRRQNRNFILGHFWFTLIQLV